MRCSGTLSFAKCVPSDRSTTAACRNRLDSHQFRFRTTALEPIKIQNVTTEFELSFLFQFSTTALTTCRQKEHRRQPAFLQAARLSSRDLTHPRIGISQAGIADDKAGDPIRQLVRGLRERLAGHPRTDRRRWFVVIHLYETSPRCSFEVG